MTGYGQQNVGKSSGCQFRAESLKHLYFYSPLLSSVISNEMILSMLPLLFGWAPDCWPMEQSKPNRSPGPTLAQPSPTASVSMSLPHGPMRKKNKPVVLKNIEREAIHYTFRKMTNIPRSYLNFWYRIPYILHLALINLSWGFVIY